MLYPRFCKPFKDGIARGITFLRANEKVITLAELILTLIFELKDIQISFSDVHGLLRQYR